jgi:NADH-quinone oxidoreductase subunit A
MFEYNKIVIMLLMGCLIAIAIFGLSYILIKRNYNLEKVSAYECGFQAFEDTRNRFDVKFYLVAILFIIFDLEIIYLFP